MTVVWTQEALNRLYETKEFISQDNPRRAAKFVDYLIQRGESISQNPRIGRVVPEISNSSVREIIAKKYRIVYRIQKNEIQILTVFEGHKRLSLEELILE